MTRAALLPACTEAMSARTSSASGLSMNDRKEKPVSSRVQKTNAAPPMR